MSDIKDFFPIFDLCGYITGDIAIFATDIVPDGFLECIGTYHSPDLYPGLFSMIGYKYGQSGTDFKLPDYRGLFLVGSDNTNLGSPESSAGYYLPDMLEYHQHGFPHGNSGSASYGSANDSTDANTNHSTYMTGGNETRPKNIYVMLCIKY